jgi:hypothetical protein
LEEYPVARYRKKSVEVEAFQLTERLLREKAETAEHFVVDEEIMTIWYYEDCARVETLEGVMTADIGDFIITGVKGEKYPCKPDVFKETYELVE